MQQIVNKWQASEKKQQLVKKVKKSEKKKWKKITN